MIHRRTIQGTCRFKHGTRHGTPRYKTRDGAGRDRDVEKEEGGREERVELALGRSIDLLHRQHELCQNPPFSTLNSQHLGNGRSSAETHERFASAAASICSTASMHSAKGGSFLVLSSFI